MKTRLYVVRAVVGGCEKEYLVDAGQTGSARQHVAKKHISVEIASGAMVAKLMAKGVAPESSIPETGGEQQTLVADPDPATS